MVVEVPRDEARDRVILERLCAYLISPRRSASATAAAAVRALSLSFRNGAQRPGRSAMAPAMQPLE